VKKQRKHYTAEEKVAILRRHLLEQEPVSKLCDELGLQPTVEERIQLSLGKPRQDPVLSVLKQYR
jgi:transposase